MTTMEEFTGETTYRGSQYLEETVGSNHLSEIYYRLSQTAVDVFRAQNELKRVVADNESKFAEMLHLHRGDVVVTRAADYERALAKYETIEKVFIEMTHASGLSRDTTLNLIRVARDWTK